MSETLWKVLDLENVTMESAARAVGEAIISIPPHCLSLRIGGTEVAELLVHAAGAGTVSTLAMPAPAWQGFRCVRCCKDLTAPDCATCGLGRCCCVCVTAESV